MKVRPCLCLSAFISLIKLRECAVDSLDKHCAILGREPSANHQHTIIIIVPVQFPPGELGCRCVRIHVSFLILSIVLRLSLHTLILAYQHFHVLSGAVTGNVQQEGFIFRRRAAGHGTHLGIADCAACECLINLWQFRQTFCDPHLLPRGAQIDTAIIVEPVRRRLDPTAIAPGIALDERRQKFQKAMLGGIDVAGQSGYRSDQCVIVSGDFCAALGADPGSDLGACIGVSEVHFRAPFWKD